MLDRFRQAARARGDSAPTTDALVLWARAFILFHNKRHPAQLGFFYGQVLEIDLGKLDAVRARRGKRLPVVLIPEEVHIVLETGGNGSFLITTTKRIRNDPFASGK